MSYDVAICLKRRRIATAYGQLGAGKALHPCELFDGTPSQQRPRKDNKAYARGLSKRDDMQQGITDAGFGSEAPAAGEKAPFGDINGLTFGAATIVQQRYLRAPPAHEHLTESHEVRSATDETLQTRGKIFDGETVRPHARAGQKRCLPNERHIMPPRLAGFQQASSEGIRIARISAFHREKIDRPRRISADRDRSPRPAYRVDDMPQGAVPTDRTDMVGPFIDHQPI